MTNDINIAVKNLNNGDIKTFEWIFKTYYCSLCFYAERIVGEKAAAEDTVSDFFLKLWENREIIIITTSLQSYLYKGVHNNCLKYLEHLKVLRKYREHAQYMIDNYALFQLQTEHQPLSLLISHEAVTEIENAIDSLPAQCKEVFLLARMEGLSYQEIAEKLDISVNTVRTQITRAMTKLRNSLGELIKNYYSKVKATTGYTTSMLSFGE